MSHAHVPALKEEINGWNLNFSPGYTFHLVDSTVVLHIVYLLFTIRFANQINCYFNGIRIFICFIQILMTCGFVQDTHEN